MIVVEVSHAHVMKFLPSHCEFLSLSVYFLGEKCGDENFISFFLNIWLNLKISSCFSTNLTPVCEECVHIYLFIIFYMERQP
jgi:hypothetical protein